MYCLDVDAIDSAWKNYWDNFYASAWDVYRNAGPLLKIPPFMQFLATRIASELIEPYICVRRTPTSPWQLGIPFGAFRPNALVHPGIFKQGPAEKEFRNPCAWVETDTAKKKDHPDWPYGGKPDQHSSLRGTRYATTTSPATTKPPPDGYRCMPWPAPEAAAAEYAPVYETLIKPAVQALRERQIRCLSSTLVCAYTRPVALDKKPAYAAFEKSAKLRTLCLDMREKLLKHDARFLVNLKDVDDIDPKFADALRKSGVNNSFGQKQSIRDRLGAADLTGDDAPLPPAPPPGGGVAFENLAPTPEPPSSLLKLAAGAGAPVELPFGGVPHPYGIAVDGVGNVYVTDDRDDERGVFMLAANSGTPTALAFPGSFRRTGIAVDSAGSVYVVDASANKVLKLAAGANAPTELPLTGLDKPKNVAVDAAGNVYVINEGGRRVLKLPTGN